MSHYVCVCAQSLSMYEGESNLEKSVVSPSVNVHRQITRVCTVDYIWWKSQRVCVTGGLIENGKYLIVTMCVGVSFCMLACKCAFLFGKPPLWSERAPHFSPFAACFGRWICTETSRFSFIKSNDISSTFMSPWNISKVHLQLSGVWLSIIEWERRATTWFQAAGFKKSVCILCEEVRFF